jgi:hypothetical protein
MPDLSRRVRILSIVCALNGMILAVLLLSGFSKPARLRAIEVDAERINIVDPAGKHLLVMAGRQRIPGPSAGGKEYPRSVSDGREYLSGLIFFNEEGDEVGGLLFNGIKKEAGGYSAVGHLSFDQWKQNQVVAIQYIDGGKTRRAGLNVWDRPVDAPMERELDRIARMQQATGAAREALQREASEARARGEQGVQRVFLGSQDKEAQLVLRDTKGRVRARLLVDSGDAARLEFIDEGGTTIATYPPAK